MLPRARLAARLAPIALLTSASLVSAPLLAQNAGGTKGEASDAAKDHQKKTAEAVAAGWASAPVDEVSKTASGSVTVDGRKIVDRRAKGTPLAG